MTIISIFKVKEKKQNIFWVVKRTFVIMLNEASLITFTVFIVGFFSSTFAVIFLDLLQ